MNIVVCIENFFTKRKEITNKLKSVEKGLLQIRPKHEIRNAYTDSFHEFNELLDTKYQYYW